ncbi:hypothetical protein RRF57_000321 [Xylaria bambusicola]|uniref:Uncharacterized protein n=1 Tax=Xylaria bambusicola TaxID=326684 RepID=A0AAN7YU22_9PEZI
MGPRKVNDSGRSKRTQDILDEFKGALVLANTPFRLHDHAHGALDTHPHALVVVDEFLAADDVAAPHGIRQLVNDLVDLDHGAGAAVLHCRRERL